MAIESIFKNNNFEWVDVEMATEEDLETLHRRYSINMLLLEDTIDRDHLPKFEEVEGVKFYLTRENTDLERRNLNGISDISTKLSIFIFGKTLITVHRVRNNSITEVLKLLRQPENAESYTADRTVLMLGLEVIKSYDTEYKNLLQLLDKMENEIFLKNTSDTNQIRRLYRLKRKAALNTRLVNLSAEWIEALRSLENLQDVQVADLLDKQKDVLGDFEHLNNQASNMLSMFLALSDQKANQTMKLLAIYSVYFLPITFIAGLYGMNFDNMPELHHRYGYFITLGVMAVIVFFTFLYMRRKKW